MRLVWIIAGLQFLLVQIFNWVALQAQFQEDTIKYYGGYLIGLTPLAAWLATISPLMSGLLFTGILLAINHYYSRSSTLQVFFPVLDLIISLLNVLIGNSLLAVWPRPAWGQPVVYVGAFVIGGLAALGLQKFVQRRWANVVFQKKLDHFWLWNYFIIVFILGLSTFEPQLVRYVRLPRTGLDSLFLLTILLVILFSAIYFLYLVQKLRQQNYAMQLHQLENYTAVLEQNFQEMRRFKHDYINVLAASLGFIKQQNLKGLKDYYQKAIQLVENSFTDDDLRISDLQNIQPGALKGFWAYQLLFLHQKKLKLHFECLQPMNDWGVPVQVIMAASAILLQTSAQYVQQRGGQLNIGLMPKTHYLSVVMQYSIVASEAHSSRLHQLFDAVLAAKSEYDPRDLKTLITTWPQLELLSSYDHGWVTEELLIQKTEVKAWMS